MKKAGGFLLIVIGILMILISIIALVKAFDVFGDLGSGAETYSYVFGSIVIPLLITVTGRWLFRKGNQLLREKKT